MTERVFFDWELAQEAMSFVRNVAREVVDQDANAAVVLGPEDTAFLRDWGNRLDALNAPPPPKEGE
jgi:hypothetical protein